MKQIITNASLLLFAFFINLYTLHAQQFKWVRGGGTGEDLSSYFSDETSKGMCTDPNGNVYSMNVVGMDAVYADTFYRSSGGYGNPQNILITSYNCSGQMRWAKLVASSWDACIPFGIASDNLGHVYLAAEMPAATLHIGNDTTIPGLANDRIGVIQFDTNGHFNWIRYVGDNTAITSTATNTIRGCLTVDNSGNAHFLPYIKSGVNLMSGVTSHYGMYDLAYDPAGTLFSATRLDLDSEWFVHGAVIDPATGKLYVCGEINQFIYGGTLTDTFYAAAFDASRNLIWQKFAGDSSEATAINGISMDQTKHLHFIGAAQSIPVSTSRFIFNGDTASNTHFYDCTVSVIMTTDTNGHVEWINKVDANSAINITNGITQLPNNKVAAAGVGGGITVDAAGHTTISPATEGQNAFVEIIDSGGDLQTYQVIHGDGFYDGATAITSDKVGNIYIGGYVEDSIWAGTIPAYHTVGGNSDFFIMKYGVDCSCTAMPIATFTDTGTHTVGVAYTGTTAGIDSVVWSFGDGGTATGLTATHTYSATGTYHVCATVYTDCGNDIHCSNVVIVCPLPVASFTDTGTHTLGATYTGTTTGIDSIVWHFGDGFTGTGTTAVHTYSASGTYHVCAIAYTACGTDTACADVAITVPALLASSANAPAARVYPSPATSELHITGLTESTRYRLLGVAGVCVAEGVFMRGSNVVSLKDYAPGVYILELFSGGGVKNRVRVVKE